METRSKLMQFQITLSSVHHYKENKNKPRPNLLETICSKKRDAVVSRLAWSINLELLRTKQLPQYFT